MVYIAPNPYRDRPEYFLPYFSRERAIRVSLEIVTRYSDVSLEGIQKRLACILALSGLGTLRRVCFLRSASTL